MNLAPHHISTLQNLFAKHPSIKEALLFGSRALGTHRESSDIDIALKGDISPTLIAHLKEELEDSTLPYFCDIISYEKAPKKLKESIDSHALPLYTKEEQWQEARLGELVEIKYGKDHKHLKCGTFPTYGSGGIMRYVDSAIYEKESVLIPRKGTLNNIFYTKTPFWVVDTMFYTIIDTQKIYPKFLYYALKTFDFNLYNVGSAVPSLTTKILNDLTIPLPPLERQREIAEILSSFDDKIDFLHRQNKTLESLAQTLFRHYFIENAKEEWEEKPLSEIATFLNGLACQKIPPKNDLDKLPVLKIKELREGKILDSSDWATSGVEDKFIVRQGDMIFSWSATLMVEIWGGENCVLNQHLFKVIADKGYPQWFCYFWCKYHLKHFISIASAHATTMGHIKRQDLDNAMCHIPSEEFIKQMDSEISPLMLKLVRNFKEAKDFELLHRNILEYFIFR